MSWNTSEETDFPPLLLEELEVLLELVILLLEIVEMAEASAGCCSLTSFLLLRRFRIRQARGESEDTWVMKLVRVLDPRRRQAASS